MEEKAKLFKKGKKASIIAGLGTFLFALAKGVGCNRRKSVEGGV